MTEDVTPENIESVLTTDDMVEELGNIIAANPDLPSSKFLGAVQIRLKKGDKIKEQLEFQLRQFLLS